MTLNHEAQNALRPILIVLLNDNQRFSRKTRKAMLLADDVTWSPLQLWLHAVIITFLQCYCSFPLYLGYASFRAETSTQVHSDCSATLIWLLMMITYTDLIY